jgi:predicted RecA/RadA family phage recombinase
MKNYVQAGDAIYVPAPTGGCKSGDIVVVANIFGVAGTTQAAGEIVAVHNDGIYSLTKKTNQAWTPGQLIYWDTGNKWATSVKITNCMLIGVATPLAPAYTAVAALNDAVGDVRLNRAFGT